MRALRRQLCVQAGHFGCLFSLCITPCTTERHKTVVAVEHYLIFELRHEILPPAITYVVSSNRHSCIGILRIVLKQHSLTASNFTEESSQLPTELTDHC